MRPFLRLVARFGRDESGVFAIMFGLMAVVLIAMGGAVVDYVRLEQTRNRAQIALDAAALALHHEIFEDATEATIKKLAGALVVERVGDSAVFANVDVAHIDLEKGSLYLEAEMKMPTLFVGLVGVNELGARIVSESTRRRSELEVVMVLDNSGSMEDYFQGLDQFRMTNLVNAAQNAVSILYGDDAAQAQKNVKIGIVPFTQFVNVGTANANKPWLNRSGTNAIMRDNFDNDGNPATSFIDSFDRIALFDQLSGTYSWGGCVEARQSPYDTNDTAPTTPETKFVPLFAPDEPDAQGFGNNYLSDTGGTCTAAATCTAVTTYNSCNSWRQTCSGEISTKYSFKAANGTVTNNLTACPQMAGEPWVAQRSEINFSARTKTTPQVLGRAMQERICKYDGGVVTKASRTQATGPNADCPIHPVVPLTLTKQTVVDAIEAMRPLDEDSNQPEGGTNIAQGAVWGLHALTSGEPLTEAAQPSPYLQKVMILMTDGDNFHRPSDNMNGSAFFPAYGYPYNNTRMNAGRLGTPGQTEVELMDEMNRRTLATCAAAKAEPNNIQIYTIGLYSTNETTIQMLKDCSSGSGYYYPATATNLSAVFQSIAQRLQALRVSQ
ncbi:von Willebrand factor type A [Devosia sp. LC5]|uniref:TadE/TadG family type IV pilus assembly protein n=1 Tax=Devosia sp. LC5 TaxID=1502724 RepID=UPI0004E46A68|nr:TadE/TadG family type IV pilus assembly protein [Devosia sp. LC5]KFC68387.1 von Willebrand factor type A [Devosia sp. LC5]